MDIDAFSDAARPGPYVFTEERARAWTRKGYQRAAELLPLAGEVARPSAVRHEVVTDPGRWPHGRFMGAWLDESETPRVLRHLPEVDFFMKLLTLAYQPVLNGRADRLAIMADSSRLEMSLTNDALQIQLVTLTPGYSMIRHHALMLFEAALWLDEPERTAWLDLYDDLVTAVDAAPEGRPDLDGLAEIEAGAFADFAELAPLTIRAEDAEALLADRDRLRRVLDYQRCAAVAIGLLWRAYREVPADERQAWHREQLSTGYVRPDYLEKEWMTSR
jgi:hypothetical protein